MMIPTRSSRPNVGSVSCTIENLSDPNKAIVVTARSSTSTQTTCAMRALEELHMPRSSRREPVPANPETQLDVVGSDDERNLSVRGKIAVAWENLFKKVDKAAGGSREGAPAVQSRRGTSRRTARPEVVPHPEAVGWWSKTFRQHISVSVDGNDGWRSTQMVRSTRSGDADRAIESYSEILAIDPEPSGCAHRAWSTVRARED